MKNLVALFVCVASIIVLAGCATSQQIVKANKRLDEAEKVIDATRKDLDAAKSGSVKQISDAQVGIRDLQSKVTKLENRPVTMAAPGLSADAVRQIAKEEAKQAAKIAFVAGQTVAEMDRADLDKKVFATKEDMEKLSESLLRRIEAATVPQPPQPESRQIDQVPADAGIAKVLECWPQWPSMASAHFESAYLAQSDGLSQGFTWRYRWVEQLKKAGATDPNFATWVDNQVCETKARLERAGIKFKQ